MLNAGDFLQRTGLGVVLGVVRKAVLAEVEGEPCWVLSWLDDVYLLVSHRALVIKAGKPLISIPLLPLLQLSCFFGLSKD